MISNLSYKTSFKIGQTIDQNFKVVNFLSPEKFEKCQKKNEIMLKHENFSLDNAKKSTREDLILFKSFISVNLPCRIW